MPEITGYPDFSRLEDQEVAGQFRLVWDALIGVSGDVAGIVPTDITELTAKVADEELRRQTLERRVTAQPGATALRCARFAGTAVVSDEIVWGTEDFNDDSVLFVPQASNVQIKVAEAGTYLVSINMRTSGTSANGLVRFYIRKGGATLCYVDTGASIGGAGGIGLMVIDEAAAGDYYTVYCPDPAPIGESTAKFSFAKLR